MPLLIGTDGGLYRVDGGSFRRVPDPGEPREAIETWAVHDGEVLRGAGLFDIPGPRGDVQGRIGSGSLDGEYETVGHRGANVGRIEAV